MNHAEKARDLFRAGYNCAQSVVGAFHEEMGLSLEDAVRLASSFGGGMGGMRETCGAVTGMFLVAGMLKGYDDPADYDARKPTMPASGNWQNSSGRNTTLWSVGSCCRRCPAS